MKLPSTEHTKVAAMMTVISDRGVDVLDDELKKQLL